MNFSTGMPPIRVQLRIGHIVSPCPPSTMASTLSTDMPAASATKYRYRVVSRAPAIPKSLFRGDLRFWCSR
jgi:hypothetical protein